ncbi:unnamed protein product [Cyprideis torosa]|uniref:Uncharacterized protein n=1 Tax=Cyprideis torosa TaxID=163714 RepID=A0A7R8WMJ6_9CRUS|nr:unnamed protein product [Cyprideis torosa]CAG0902862.1 unnamed protein product [Cyprideis torosa]
MYLFVPTDQNEPESNPSLAPSSSQPPSTTRKTPPAYEDPPITTFDPSSTGGKTFLQATQPADGPATPAAEESSTVEPLMISTLDGLSLGTEPPTLSLEALFNSGGAARLDGEGKVRTQDQQVRARSTGGVVRGCVKR